MEVGSVVRLKSGGPLMTIEWVDCDKAKCQWFDDKNAVKDAMFPLAALEEQGEGGGTIQMG